MSKRLNRLDPRAMERDPTRFFDDPEDVVSNAGLSDTEKLAILRQWEIDARLLSVADDENMAGDQPNPLDRILSAIELVRKRQAMRSA